MISVIIPAYNEAKALPATLTRLHEQQPGFEVLLVDGGSQDDTVAIAAQFPKIRILVAPKGRASQLNAGAAAARGEWLLFLHADTLLPRDALTVIAALADSVNAGGFRQQFSGRGVGLKLISWLHNYRCRRTGVVYGDQSLFVRKPLFDSLGGFPPVLMEDLYFGERLRERTKPVLLNYRVVTDSRKFEQQGVWRSFLRVVALTTCAQMGWAQLAFTRRFFDDAR